MTPHEPHTESPASPRTAGQMLRAAREAKGLHLAMLSVNLKVSVRQLEALEADRHEDFKGLTFVRALAQSVSRQLGIDPAPVLAALPQAASLSAIEPVAIDSKRQALRAQPVKVSVAGQSRQVLILAVLMLLGVAALVWWPGNASQAPSAVEEANDPAQAAVPMGQASNPEQSPDQAEASEALVATVSASAPAAVAAVTPSASIAVAVASAPAPSASAPLVLHLHSDMWVEVRDARGQTPVKRTVRAGETLQLSNTPPLFVYLGKADAAELRWQGQLVDLKPHSQNNEARLQLKP